MNINNDLIKNNFTFKPVKTYPNVDTYKKEIINDNKNKATP